ncbi:YciI family protein [Paracraurococcus lichenis]|uniref:YciI family protein n=1 Tax=Paracraurococcus lichenis TaxID=3064888 RepID=A0ABT9DTU7_9PROT|nr:YciI family protein [Paracraurococcus sp. LOR1-02]MDO9707333.1 YciI family protein [Paracraurococcus sp. LOR1-02]
MGFAVLAFDGEDDGAPARRLAARPRHLEVLTDWAGSGRLAFGTPLLADDGRALGSFMVLNGDDPAILERYLAEEPFNNQDVWRKRTTWPFRIAPLPYRPLPQPGTPLSPVRTHTVVIAWDGTDAGAQDRRMAVRGTHLDRVRPMAGSGMLALGGAFLDPGGERMIGSAVVIAAETDAAARAWLAEDPYTTGGVWQETTLYGTRFAPLPYQPLPGAA